LVINRNALVGLFLGADTSVRAVHLEDGWYVLGAGMSIPVASKEEAEETIRQMTAGKGSNTDERKA
jgi:hypothetical protein